MRRTALLLAAWVLAGCGHLGPDRPEQVVTDLSSHEAVQSFVLDGRVSVKTSEEQYSGHLRWDRTGPGETLRLNTPLGQGVAEIRRTADGLVLTDADGRSYPAEDADSLLQRVMGVRLPLEGLVYWLYARPRPEASHRARLDALGRVSRLEQDGWSIEYDRYQDREGLVLPGRLFATRDDGIQFRLIVDQWHRP